MVVVVVREQTHTVGIRNANTSKPCTHLPSSTWLPFQTDPQRRFSLSASGSDVGWYMAWETLAARRQLPLWPAGHRTPLMYTTDIRVDNRSKEYRQYGLDVNISGLCTCVCTAYEILARSRQQRRSEAAWIEDPRFAHFHKESLVRHF